jgi:DNA repair protein RadC
MENLNTTLMLRELPVSERPREKIKSLGTRGVSNAELLAILIGSGTEKESAISLAQRVLSLEKGGLSALADYEVEEFMQVKGIGLAKASRLVSALELGRRIAAEPPVDRFRIHNPTEIAGIFVAGMRGYKKEVFKIALFNAKMEYTGNYDVSMGGLSSTAASPREIFAMALKKGAYAVALIHNHPSGNPEPSSADIEMTCKAIQSGWILNIEVVDHIIVGDNTYISMRELYPDIFKTKQ